MPTISSNTAELVSRTPASLDPMDLGISSVVVMKLWWVSFVLGTSCVWAVTPEDLHRAATELDVAILVEALDAVNCAEAAGAGQADTLTVIDYARPSSEARLWTFDLHTGHLLFHEWVAHGQGTGTEEAKHFSNQAGSRKSSLGLFRTAETYHGNNGYSLRLDGLNIGVNDNARARAIVMHGADYVDSAFIQRHGRLGRSWGCPAVRRDIARVLLDRIKHDGWLYAYHPSRQPAACAVPAGTAATSAITVPETIQR